MLIGQAIRTVFGIIAYIEQDNLSLSLMQIYHKFPCPIYAIIPNTLLLVGFYWNHKPLAGGRRLGEAQVFEKCDKTNYNGYIIYHTTMYNINSNARFNPISHSTQHILRPNRCIYKCIDS